MSEVKVDKISPRSGTDVTLGDSGDTFTIPSGATLTNSGTASGFGKVLQVVSSTKTDTASTTSTSFVTTGLEATITPASTSNKIYIVVTSAVGMDADTAPYFQLYRDASVVSGAIGATGGDTGDRGRTSAGTHYQTGTAQSFNYLDSPSTTSATTYKWMWSVGPSRPGGSTIYLNFISGNLNEVYYYTSPSTMTLMEIAA